MAHLDLALEQVLLRGHQQLPCKPKNVLVAVSGGLDSMVLVELLLKWRRGLKVNLAVAHIHHGPAKEPEQTHFRNMALEFVRDWSQQRGLTFYTNTTAPKEQLTSEQAWRDWRESWLRQWLETGGFDAVAMGHHMDDLLETRLLRLIRGSGPQGLRAMSLFVPGRWRPLLEVTRTEIQRYALSRRLVWVEDPSNSSSDLQRNWLRREWLPLLEARVPGGGRSLARSLESLLRHPESIEVLPFVGLRREALEQATRAEQREIVARFLKSLGLQGYQSTHVDEILKRAVTPSGDVRQRPQNFRILEFTIHITNEIVWASRG